MKGDFSSVCPRYELQVKKCVLRYSSKTTTSFSCSSKPSFLHLSATLVNFRNACIHMNIIHSLSCFFFKKKKKRQQTKKSINLPTCQ